VEYHLEVLPTAALAAEAAGRRFVLAAGAAIPARGQFLVTLSGGSTPRSVYTLLARAPWAAELDWSRIRVLWGDERCVPPDHEESNYRMAREALLDHVPIPPANVHRIHGEEDPVQAAAAYERLLRALLGRGESPGIDFAFLGLGEDGHTASLFPGSMAVRDDARWVRAQYVERVARWRVTLTPAALNAAAEVAFIALGRAKAAIVQQVLEGPRRPDQLPAQRIAPASGQLRWFLDADAAAGLRQRPSPPRRV
jgi:6-phosphogluconolactonase